MQETDAVNVLKEDTRMPWIKPEVSSGSNSLTWEDLRKDTVLTALRIISGIILDCGLPFPSGAEQCCKEYVCFGSPPP
eukprot:417753-Hanusia_phi.AAC.1